MPKPPTVARTTSKRGETIAPSTTPRMVITRVDPARRQGSWCPECGASGIAVSLEGRARR